MSTITAYTITCFEYSLFKLPFCKACIIIWQGRPRQLYLPSISYSLTTTLTHQKYRKKANGKGENNQGYDLAGKVARTKKGGEMAVPHLRQGESQKGRQQDRYKVREEDRQTGKQEALYKVRQEERQTRSLEEKKERKAGRQEALQKERQEALQKGRQEALQKGRQEGRETILDSH